MSRFLNAVRRSFAARLSMVVVLFAALVFLASIGYTALQARKSVTNEAMLRADQVLENSVLRLDSIIEDVEIAADNLEWLVLRHLDSPDSMMVYSRNTVESNSFLNGCSIAFEPDYFPGRHYYSAYSVRVDGDIETEQEGDDDYQYFYLDWYQLPELLGKACWTEPYSDWDQDDNEDLQTEMLVSYCKPLYDDDGRFIGVISLDIALSWLSDMLATVRPYPNSYAFLVSRGGTYLVHPDSDRLFYETMYTPSLENPDPSMLRLGRAMQGMEEGFQRMDVDGKRCYVFYTPVESIGWSMGLVCPWREVFGSFNYLRRTAALIALLGLLLLFLVCSRVIGREMKPLSALASQAEDIASGNFGTRLPETTREDELGTLTHSFAHMQESLVSYIDELTKTTAQKSQIQKELQIAQDIQMGMLPRSFPPFPDRHDIGLYASMVPAREVGGDLYDYFIQGGRLYFCIGDVSGKGIPASLVMATAMNLFRVVGRQELPPAEIARQINETLAEGNEQMMFVTMFIGALDLADGGLDFCNCGHNPPVLLSRGGEAKFLSCKANTCIGVVPGYAFEGEHVELKDTPLFLYTDGVTEAEDPEHEQFGEGRLVAALSGRYEGVEAVARGLAEKVKEHVGGALASDDLTMVCLEWQGGHN